MGISQVRDLSRELKMVELFKAGNTLQSIGDVYGLTRERVRQIIRRHGVTGKDGGHNALEFRAARYGMELEDFLLVLKGMPNCFSAWRSQRKAAKNRGIPWELSFKEWTEIWLPHWGGRGRGHGLVMCRKKDQGAYKVGNVFIAPGSFNNSAYQIRRWYGIDIDADPYFHSAI